MQKYNFDKIEIAYAYLRSVCQRETIPPEYVEVFRAAIAAGRPISSDELREEAEALIAFNQRQQQASGAHDFSQSFWFLFPRMLRKLFAR